MSDGNHLERMYGGKVCGIE